MPEERGMGPQIVLAILSRLADAGCQGWIGGGWGVDALVAHQTRPHRDLDLAVDARHESAAIAALSTMGFTVRTDWRPVRVELAAPHERRVTCTR